MSSSNRSGAPGVIGEAQATAHGSGPTIGVSNEPQAAITDVTTIVFDVETTGTDKRRDQIIELCAQFGVGDNATNKTWRFKPSVAISPGAQAVHGISMEDLADKPAFSACVDEILELFRNAQVVIGYNLSFDIDMVQAELERMGRPLIDFSTKTIVDPFRLWQQCEPRSLQHAHQRFVGEKFASAHSASADVAATGRVLLGMLKSFGLEGQDWKAVADVCDPQRSNWVGPSRHLQWDAAGAVIITFGKHAGSALHVLAQGSDAGYLRWVVGKDFPAHVLEICRAAMDQTAEEFLAWAKQRYGVTGGSATFSGTETRDR